MAMLSAARILLIRVRILPAIAVCIVLIATVPGRAYADPPSPSGGQSSGPVLEVTQQDRNGDGTPDLTIIHCVIRTPNDRVLVFDGAKNMRRSSAWEEATDFTDDTWVFDIGGNGGNNQATIIIAFSKEGNDTLARVYDGSLTGGVVQYEVAGSIVHVSSPQYPSLIIRAKGQWLNPDGTLNYNLIWQFDGPAANRDLAKLYPNAFALDGNPDAEGESRAAGQNGIPEYLWNTLLAPIPMSERVPRTGIQVNSGHHRPSSPSNVVFWPFLNQPEDPAGKNYFDTPLFLGIDWQAGLIKSFSFQGYPVEEGYHVNSLDVLKPGRVNTLSFENPMGYYDLAQDYDGRPELHIRFAYTPAGTPGYAMGGPTRSPVEMVQYSWNQRNDDALHWDYKVDLAGRNAISQTVTLGDMVIEQVPHEQLPRWVVEHPWGFATFIAYETGDGYLSSEGLYDWSTLEGVQSYGGIYAGSTLAGAQAYTGSSVHIIQGSAEVQRDYLAGVSNKSPVDLYQSILTGFRGEYGDVNRRAWLYFSPIDARLHLEGATHGVFNMGNNRRLEYRSLEGQGVVDSWQLFERDNLVSQLQQSNHYLVYGTDGQVTLLRADIPRKAFRTQPPASHDDWLKLGGLLSANKRDFGAGDLGEMLKQFDGAQMTIRNASLSDYRPVGEDGFRFVLDLRPGFYVEGGDFLPLAGLNPGQYVVTYQGTYTIEPLTPPSLSATVATATLTQLQPGTLQVVVSNQGLQDVPAATFELWATALDGQSSLVTTRTVDLLARQPFTVTIAWAPPQAGKWSLTPQISEPDGLRIPFNAAEVTVRPAQQAGLAVVVADTASFSTSPVIVLGLATCAAMAAFAVWTTLKSVWKDRADDVQ